MSNGEWNLQRPIITIIVPVYNVEKYLVRCLNSIVNQTYKNLQIILIDDGSTDNSGKICDDYSRNDHRISVIHKRNEGLSAARNEGLDIAEGKYIGFVDSDDYIELDMYEQLYKLIESTDAEMAVCEFTYIEDSGIKREKEEELPVKTKMDADTYIKKWIDSRYKPFYVVAWNKLYKKKLFDGIRYPVDKYREDEYVIHHLVYQCSKIIYISKSFYYYKQHTGSIMKTSDVRLMDLGDALIDRYYLAKRESNNLLRKETIKLLVNEIWEWKVFNHYDVNFKEKYLDYKKKSFRIVGKELFLGDGKSLYSILEKVWICMRVAIPKFSYAVYCLARSWRKLNE